MTEAHREAHEAAHVAEREYRASQAAYRKNGDVAEFDVAIAKHRAAMAAFDAALALADNSNTES